jgi:hypothetical protein
MSLWTDIRDTAESAAVVAGDYFLPGSSLVTSKLTSEGSQAQLNSNLGKLARLGASGAGGYEGNLSNYGTAHDKVAGVFGGGTGGQITGQQAVDAFNAGKISPTEFEAIANGAGTTMQGLLSGGAGLSKYLTPAAILGSSIFGAQAASKAADTQAAAQSQANQLAYSMFQQQNAQQEPWRQAGVTALGKLSAASDYTPFGMDQFKADPGYAFRLSEGQKALDRSAAARGGLISGTALKAATGYGQEMGSQEYTNAFNRYQTERSAKLQPLQSLAGIGQSATNVMGANAGNYADTAGQGIANIGNVQAAGQMGGANALAGGVSQYLNYAGNENLLNALSKRTA